MDSAAPYAWLEASLKTIKKAYWYRQERTITGLPGSTVTIDGQTVVNFGSNDYLGLAGDPRLQAAAIAATEAYGTGSTGSRLTSGHRQLHRDLEQAIAGLKQTEAALVFSSGYLANLGTIAALVGKRDLIVGDRYNHSSLKNGAILSQATVMDYPHNDMSALREILVNHRDHHRRCLISTDSVFSMDGDLCPLLELQELAREFSAMLLIDEAHSTGILGAKGAGVAEHFGLTQVPIIQVGTLSKALGSLGGYVAGSRALIDFLRNRAPSWIYTTGLSPADCAAALKAIELLAAEPHRREQLWRNIQQFKAALGKHLLVVSESAILCFGLQDPQAALSLGDRLLKAGFFAPAIRPPTVPTSRIRLSVMASHTPEQIEMFIEWFRGFLQE